jgi:hypothetical protein
LNHARQTASPPSQTAPATRFVAHTSLCHRPAPVRPTGTRRGSRRITNNRSPTRGCEPNDGPLYLSQSQDLLLSLGIAPSLHVAIGFVERSACIWRCRRCSPYFRRRHCGAFRLVETGFEGFFGGLRCRIPWFEPMSRRVVRPNLSARVMCNSHGLHSFSPPHRRLHSSYRPGDDRTWISRSARSNGR